MGTPKGFTVMIGGNAGIKPRIADVLAQQLTADEVLVLADKVVKYYKENANKYERLGRMIDRLGAEKVKQDLLG